MLVRPRAPRVSPDVANWQVSRAPNSRLATKCREARYSSSVQYLLLYMCPTVYLSSNTHCTRVSFSTRAECTFDCSARSNPSHLEKGRISDPAQRFHQSFRVGELCMKRGHQTVEDSQDDSTTGNGSTYSRLSREVNKWLDAPVDRGSAAFQERTFVEEVDVRCLSLRRTCSRLGWMNQADHQEV